MRRWYNNYIRRFVCGFSPSRCRLLGWRSQWSLSVRNRRWDTGSIRGKRSVAQICRTEYKRGSSAAGLWGKDQLFTPIASAIEMKAVRRKERAGREMKRINKWGPETSETNGEHRCSAHLSNTTQHTRLGVCHKGGIIWPRRVFFFQECMDVDGVHATWMTTRNHAESWSSEPLRNAFVILRWMSNAWEIAAKNEMQFFGRGGKTRGSYSHTRHCNVISSDATAS